MGVEGDYGETDNKSRTRLANGNVVLNPQITLNCLEEETFHCLGIGWGRGEKTLQHLCLPKKFFKYEVTNMYVKSEPYS